MISAPAPATSRYSASSQRLRKASSTAAAPVTVHSTPSLPSQVTALITETSASCPGDRGVEVRRGTVVDGL